MQGGMFFIDFESKVICNTSTFLSSPLTGNLPTDLPKHISKRNKPIIIAYQRAYNTICDIVIGVKQQASYVSAW